MKSAPLRFALYLALVYVFIKVIGILAGSPFPSSVVTVYMLIAASVLLLVMTSTDEGARALSAPIKEFCFEGGRLRRLGVLILPPLCVSILITFALLPGSSEPLGLRVIHPTPPVKIHAYGRDIILEDLENPYRALKDSDPVAFREVVKEGGEVYFTHCFFCHGALLDGKGHFARALMPQPLPFKGTDTIAQLEESYVFWRVLAGGKGLPVESEPWSSSMPAWEDELTEAEIWKVILFIYDFTGNEPRRWED